MSTTKWCARCRETKSVAEFYVNQARHDGLSGYCVECHGVAQRESAQRRRQAVLDHLGGKCVRCGFDDFRALQIDHVNGGGAQERETVWATSATFYEKVMADDGTHYQLLCANCNWIKKFEALEHVGRREYTRAIPTERKDPVGYTEERRQQQSEFMRQWYIDHPDEAREKAEKMVATKTGGKWSINHDACVSCGKIEDRHVGNGLCEACYYRNRRQPAYTRSKGDRWARDYDACTKCDTTEIPHAGGGLCRTCYQRDRAGSATTRGRNARPGEWAAGQDACRGCGRTDRPHRAKGLCNPCYLADYKARTADPTRIRPRGDERSRQGRRRGRHRHGGGVRRCRRHLLGSGPPRLAVTA